MLATHLLSVEPRGAEAKKSKLLVPQQNLLAAGQYSHRKSSASPWIYQTRPRRQRAGWGQHGLHRGMGTKTALTLILFCQVRMQAEPVCSHATQPTAISKII